MYVAVYEVGIWPFIPVGCVNGATVISSQNISTSPAFARSVFASHFSSKDTNGRKQASIEVCHPLGGVYTAKKKNLDPSSKIPNGILRKN